MTTVLTVPLQTAISENTITIFSKSWCPYCKRAKALLMQRHKLPEQEAYARLRKAAMDRGLKLAEVSQRLIDAAELLG